MDNSTTLLIEDGKKPILLNLLWFNISGLYIWMYSTLYSPNLNIIAINFGFANFRIYAFFLFLLFHIFLVVCSDFEFSAFCFLLTARFIRCIFFCCSNLFAFFIFHLWNVHMYGIGLHHFSVEERTKNMNERKLYILHIADIR